MKSLKDRAYVSPGDCLKSMNYGLSFADGKGTVTEITSDVKVVENLDTVKMSLEFDEF